MGKNAKYYTACKHCGNITGTFEGQCLACGGEKDISRFPYNGPLSTEPKLSKRQNAISFALLVAMSVGVMATFVYVLLIHHAEHLSNR